MQQLHIKSIHKAYWIVLSSSRNPLGFKAVFPSSPHQSRDSYSLLSLLTSRASKTFSDAQNLLYTLFFSLTKLGQSFSPQKKKCRGIRSFSLSILAFYTRTPAPPTSTFVFASFSFRNCPHQPQKPAP